MAEECISLRVIQLKNAECGRSILVESCSVLLNYFHLFADINLQVKHSVAEIGLLMDFQVMSEGILASREAVSDFTSEIWSARTRTAIIALEANTIVTMNNARIIFLLLDSFVVTRLPLTPAVTTS